MAPLKKLEDVDSKVLENLLSSIAAGDKTALAEFYEITKTPVYGFVISIMKNKVEAEDIFQDVYVKIYENANTYKQKGKPMAWVFTIAKNLCYMRFRRQKDIVNLEDIQELWVENENVEDRIILEKAFTVITDEERQIIFLHVLSGMKHREIAKILDMPIATVLSKYHRAMKKLRKELEEYGNG